VNCLAAFIPEEALQQAKKLDAILEKTGKPIGPLHGLPVPVKVGIIFPLILGTGVDQLQDTYWIKGQRTTMGFVAWKDNIATQDSTMAKILRDSGGKPTLLLTISKTSFALYYLWHYSMQFRSLPHDTDTFFSTAISCFLRSYNNAANWNASRNMVKSLWPNP
jgi:hypothetical protein